MSELGLHKSGTNTNDATATASDILNEKTAYVKGVKITGTQSLASLTADATATAADIILGKTAYSQGDKVTGTSIPISVVIATFKSSLDATYTLPELIGKDNFIVFLGNRTQAENVAVATKFVVCASLINGTYTACVKDSTNIYNYYNNAAIVSMNKSTGAIKFDGTTPPLRYIQYVVFGW